MDNSKVSIGFLCALGLVLSCRPKPKSSHITFRAADGMPGLSAKVQSGHITICSSDGSRNQDIQKAAAGWVAALGADPTIVQVVNDGVSQCDANVSLESLGNSAAYTEMGNNPHVHWDSNPDTWFGTTNVLVHEFGHAFGLLDTYVVQQGGSGQAGNCYEGQPREAVMCSPFYPVPQADDRAGVLCVASGKQSSECKSDGINAVDPSILQNLPNNSQNNYNNKPPGGGGYGNNGNNFINNYGNTNNGINGYNGFNYINNNNGYRPPGMGMPPFLPQILPQILNPMQPQPTRLPKPSVQEIEAAIGAPATNTPTPVPGATATHVPPPSNQYCSIIVATASDPKTKIHFGDATASGEAERIFARIMGNVQSLAICVGNRNVCENPHAFREIAMPVSVDPEISYFATVDLIKIPSQYVTGSPITVTSMGVDASNGHLFACETTIIP